MEQQVNSQEDLVTLLKDGGIKPSVQRIMILDYLSKNHIHPTVDTIYQELFRKIPTLSKTTVYNTLDLFAEHHLVQKIFIEDNEIRYDFNTDTHGHFKCVECGQIFDFAIESLESEIDHTNKNKIFAKEVYYRGICENCLSN